MLKKTIEYNDLDDNRQVEDFYFNFTIQELIDMELEVPGGMEAKLRSIVAAENVSAMLGTMKDIIMRAVGQKSQDGRRFDKSPELSNNFYNSPAYGALFFELISKPGAAADFMNGLMPKDLMKRAQELQTKETPAGLDHTPSATLDRKPEEYSVVERVEMSDEQFYSLYGDNARNWSKTTIVAAMRRATKTSEEVK